MRSVAIKRSAKQDREYQVLLGLVDFYLKTGKPVGSNSLKEAEFEGLSSATIRNYFSRLEKEGYLIQQHSSSGRIPTSAAFRLYAKEYENTDSLTIEEEEDLQVELKSEGDLLSFLQRAAERLSERAKCAVFFSAPRFDHDFITDLKLVSIDHRRSLCVVITDFGQIQTEILLTPHKLNGFAIKRIEDYFRWRLTGYNQPENLSLEEEGLAQQFYRELMLRYIVKYAHFLEEEVGRTGFCQLLQYPDFYDTAGLANSLALFENAHAIRLLLKEGMAAESIKFWIADDLARYSVPSCNCAVLSIPYVIGQQPVGCFAILGSMKIDYRHLSALLRAFSRIVSQELTRTVYKHKISFRFPQAGQVYLENEERKLIEHTNDKENGCKRKIIQGL